MRLKHSRWLLACFPFLRCFRLRLTLPRMLEVCRDARTVVVACHYWISFRGGGRVLFSDCGEVLRAVYRKRDDDVLRHGYFRGESSAWRDFHCDTTASSKQRNRPASRETITAFWQHTGRNGVDPRRGILDGGGRVS